MEYSLIIEPITGINANLDLIAKYHNGTKILLNPNQENKVKTQVDLKLMFATDNNGESKIVNDYHYGKIVAETLPDVNHAGNLLVLARNMMDIDWLYYQNHTAETIEGSDINLHSELEQLLKDLKVLKLQTASDGILQTKVKLRELRKVGKSEVPYDVEDMGVTVYNLHENKEIVTLLLNNRLKLISELDYLYVPLIDTTPNEWKISDIDELLAYLKQPFPDYRAKWLFGRYATQTILTYLKGEMDWNQGDVEVTQNQGVLIYTLLLLFGVVHLDIDEANNPKYKSDRDKAKLIRSFLRQDLKDKEVEFYNLMFTPFLNKI
ncbi:hypothetical protein HDC90_001534 [Pedobacter sp. AK013]|uniref:hypothetical protein n=1 Tax=Pedobacter sp. AK013 TaxID=2723071 RepID=UPI00160B3C1E|nr:hypothetical protein [Pedobacter sp. AK013]MBB6236917.1 hypothetical protein [Pedobacter sp. AK013]